MDGLDAKPPKRRFGRYPQHKDTGLKWLPVIPEHWQVRKIKHVAVVNPPTATARKLSSSLEVSFVPMEAVGQWGGLNLESTRSVEDVLSSGYTSFCDGDVLVAKITPCFENGKGALATGLIHGIGFGTTELHVIRPGPGLDPAFLAYVTFSWPFRALGQLEMKGAAGQQRVPQEFIKDFPIPLPPLQEQRAIATFLDRETAKIDALLARKERLIQLLEEKRSALIVQAVTKGLDPSVPMKDSGVEWLGEIPTHWEVTRLKQLGRLQAGAGFPEEEQGIMDEELPFFKVGDMALSPDQKHLYTAPNSVSRDTARRLGAFIFPAKTIVFAKVGAALRLNRRRVLTRPSCIDNNMMGFIPVACDHNWAFYWFSGLDLGELANPGAVPSVNEGQVRELPVAVPPVHEQRAIAAFLDREVAWIDVLSAKIREGIERLREYRTALVTAAVTGQIDVRSAVSAYGKMGGDNPSFGKPEGFGTAIQ